jgi:glutamyl aminopeptidase
MLRGFIGDEEFKQSIRNHIRKYQFSNCDMNQLWSIISETVNYKFNVSHIMNNWLTQMGYPVVNVTQLTNNNNNTNQIEYILKQDYFILFQLNPTKNDYKWIIPFTYKTKNDNNSKLIWINETETIIKVPNNNNNNNNDSYTWLLGNLNFMGYYRVNYDKQNWLKIINQLKENHLVFSSTERAALIFDSFTFARVGYIDYSIALDLASYLINEQDYVPWKSFFKSITYIDNLLSTSSCYGLFQMYGSKQIERIYSKLGWLDTGSYLEKLLRTHVIKYSAYFEHEDALERAKNIFIKYNKDETAKTEKHIVEAVYCTGIKYGNYKDWIALFNKSINLIPSEQVKYNNKFPPLNGLLH